MRIYLLLPLLTNAIVASNYINRYFDALIEFGIGRRVTFCQRTTSKLLREVRGHNWAGLIQNIDAVLDESEKNVIKSKFSRLLNTHPRLAKKSHLKAPTIPSHYHYKYRLTYRILFTYITKCDVKEFWELLVFLDRVLDQFSKRRDFDRRSRLFFVKLRRAVDELYI